MKRITLSVLIAATLCIGVSAEIRTWKTITGTVIEGDYVSTLLDDVVVQAGDGGEVRLPILKLSRDDQLYVQLRNPPKLSVDPLESSVQNDPNSICYYEGNKSFVTALYYTFGARVKQLDRSKYEHEMRAYIYVFTQQRYDPDKYHMIAKIRSRPFMLNKENNYEHEFIDDQSCRILSFNLLGEIPRGQKMGETLILIKDKRGEIIAYNSSKNWLFNGIDKLDALPVGAWINNKCNRVHPTAPKREGL
ncbi:MAG: hypothetical protein JXR25_15545 [Pontiellaceae bacterium]|nr:hypothetical protein [Pontiellaceae bacterium]MBN2786234.1 hypothetical protein [Pontiellaceae bacterium]